MPRYEKIQNIEQGIILADIGGISRGIAKNGIYPGAQCLKFVESCRILVFVIALNNKMPRSRPFSSERGIKDYSFLLEAVRSFNSGFTAKKRIIVLNRFAGMEDAEALSGIQKCFPEEIYFSVNAATGDGLLDLINWVKYNTV